MTRWLYKAITSGFTITTRVFSAYFSINMWIVFSFVVPYHTSKGIFAQKCPFSSKTSYKTSFSNSMKTITAQKYVNGDGTLDVFKFCALLIFYCDAQNLSLTYK